MSTGEDFSMLPAEILFWTETTHAYGCLGMRPDLGPVGGG